MTIDDNFVSADSFKKATKKIHEAGGCDARDEYSRGYDDAVTTALNIIRRHNRSFGGSLTDDETMRQAGISRKSFYKYKKLPVYFK